MASFKKFLNTIFTCVILMACLSESLCHADGNDDLAGIYKSDDWVEIQSGYDQNVNGKVDSAMKYDFNLYSDGYMFLNISFYVYVRTQEYSYYSEFSITGPGTWNNSNGIMLCPSEYQCNFTVNESEVKLRSNYINGEYIDPSDRAMVTYALEDEFNRVFRNEFKIKNLVDKNGAISVKESVKNGLKLTREAPSSLPFLFVPGNYYDYVFVDGENFPAPGYIYAVLHHDNKYEIGVFRRLSGLGDCYVVTCYSDGKTYTQYKDQKHFLNSDLYPEIDKKIEEMHDFYLTPESGVSEFNFYDGRVYSGEWASHKPSGEGKVTYPDGSWYKGTFSDGEFISGTGHVVWDDGSVYDGGIADSAYCGEGVFKKGTDKFWGQWKDSHLVDGTAEIHNGKNVFTCHVKDDRVSGHGVYKFAKGSYDGTFEDSDFLEGTISYNGLYEYTGSSVSYKFSDGKCVFKDGSVFDGKWVNNTIHDGSVRMYLEHPYYCRFVGIVKDGVLDTGEMSGKDDVTYSSAWSEGARELPVVVSFPNGDHASGIWNIEYGDLVEGSSFEYVWSDGVKGVFTVSKKSKITKPSYYDADGNLLKAKAVKGRGMHFILEESFCMRPCVMSSIHSFIKMTVPLPGE